MGSVQNGLTTPRVPIFWFPVFKVGVILSTIVCRPETLKFDFRWSDKSPLPAVLGEIHGSVVLTLAVNP